MGAIIPLNAKAKTPIEAINPQLAQLKPNIWEKITIPRF